LQKWPWVLWTVPEKTAAPQAGAGIGINEDLSIIVKTIGTDNKMDILADTNVLLPGIHRRDR
jgi:hypothetical protein